MKTKLGKIIKSSFKKILFYSNLKNGSNVTNNLDSYLAGLIEGDGSIIVPKTIRNQKGKLLFLKRFITSKAITSEVLGKLSNNIESSNLPLNPYYITGFVDGDGSFSVSILKRAIYKTGWSINPVFTISLYGKDIDLLYRIQSFFGVGKITIHKRDGAVYYSVNSIKDLINVIIPHFEKYPLITKKTSWFLTFQKNYKYNA
jgi:hypothetical protein